MIRNKYFAIFAVGLLVFLFFPQGTKAETALQTPVEFQMRNNETSGLNIGIKLFGSLGQIVGQNDVNKHLDGWNQLLDTAANLFGYNVSGEISPLGFGSSFGGELILSFNPSISLGLGAEYLRFSKQSTKKLTVEGEMIEFSMEPKISAIPLTLTLYYGIPVGEFLKVVLGAGAGYYLGKYEGIMRQTFVDGSGTDRFESDANTFGAHGSFNLELNIGRSMALIFGVSGRFAVFKDLIGTQTYDYSDSWGDDFETFSDQTLWYVEEEMFDGQYYASLFSDDEQPEGQWYRVARKAKISLSSMALQIGILIRLSQLFNK